MKKRENRTPLRSLPELEGTLCKNCLRKEPIKNKFRCSVLKNFYFRDSELGDHCWAFNSDTTVEIKMLEEVKEYINTKSGMINEKNLIDRKLDRLKRTADKQFNEDLKVVYIEDVHRGKLGGGGDRQDRTHKLFPEARMKDNRYKPKWGEDD